MHAFTDDQKAEVAISADSGVPSRVVVEVADNGKGIATSLLPRIFDPFVQGRAVGSGLVPGSGIGLAIAREHALAHGGSVMVMDSAHGARFRVVLPVENG